MKEIFYLDENGKAVAGWSILHDGKTGRWYDVLRVMSGRMPTAEWPRGHGGSSIEACAIYGGRRIRPSQEGVA